MLEIHSTIKKENIPKINKKKFVEIKDFVLGKNYELSLVWIGEKKSKKLNFQYRKKNKSTDILSFSINKNLGEIFINKEKAYKNAENFSRKENNFLELLFAHGCVHLLGFDHGKKMNEWEKKIHKKFKI